MKKAVPRNSPCPCGSGKKYKKCCFLLDRDIREPDKVDAIFNVQGEDVEQKITSLDSIPTHNINGLVSNVKKSDEIGLLLDLAEIDLRNRKVDMLADLTDRLVAEMNIVPQFTYRDIGQSFENDARFEQLNMQLICLKGDDPLELFVEKIT